MSSHRYAGVVVPDRVSGHIGLELANTLAGRGSATPRDYLAGDRALVAWALDTTLLPDDAAPLLEQVTEAAGPATRRARALREALHRCALGEGASSDDWALIAAAATTARRHAEFGPTPQGATWRVPAPDTPALLPTAALHAAALAAEALLGAALATTVAACPGDGCGWLFTDPRRRRRWCSMAVCGNRAKARRHAERALGR